MVGEVEDALESVNEELAAREKNCAVLNHESTTQENAWVAEGAKSNVDLALATRRLNEAEEHERLAKTERQTLFQQEHGLQQHCAESKQAIEDNLCGIRAMRLELAELGSVDAVQDCVVADWSGWSACSKDCGGGVRQRVRLVRSPVLNDG